MNRGNIPGYYFDEEKKKYFKITADHIAPVNAKYSRSNVRHEKQEERTLKKRKLHERVVRKQTVNQAKCLTSGLLRTTLQRELGRQNLGRLHAARDEALATGLVHNKVSARFARRVRPPVIRDACYTADRSRMLFATSRGSAGASIYCCDWRDRLEDPQAVFLTIPRVGLPGKFVALRHFESQFLLASAEGSGVHYFLGPIDGPEARTDGPTPLGFAPNTVQAVHACAFEPATQHIAFAGTGIMVVNGASAATLSHSNFSETRESFAATWLQPYVLAYGLHTDIAHSTPQHTVRLWDIRSGCHPCSANSSTRLKHYRRITGVEKPENNEHHLIATTNREINVYDLRMQSVTSPPLLSIEHTSIGPQLDIALKGDLVAALDELYRVQVYSLRTSQRLRTLVRDGAPKSQSPPLENLRWEENRRGSPYLQACEQGIVHQWAWGGSEPLSDR